MRFYCTSTGPIGGLNCEVLLQILYKHTYIRISAPHMDTQGGCLILTLQLIPLRCWRRWYLLPQDRQGLEELGVTSWTERVREIRMYICACICTYVHAYVCFSKGSTNMHKIHTYHTHSRKTYVCTLYEMHRSS